METECTYFFYKFYKIIKCTPPHSAKKKKKEIKVKKTRSFFNRLLVVHKVYYSKPNLCYLKTKIGSIVSYINFDRLVLFFFKTLLVYWIEYYSKIFLKKENKTKKNCYLYDFNIHKPYKHYTIYHMLLN